MIKDYVNRGQKFTDNPPDKVEVFFKVSVFALSIVTLIVFILLFFSSSVKAEQEEDFSNFSINELCYWLFSSFS